MHHRNSRAAFPRAPRRTLLATMLACAIAPSFAADPAQPTDVDDVIVTASRTAQTQDAALAAVSVITREDIDRLQPASLPDLLRGQVGMSISNNGGMGKESSVFLRGAESDQVIVLVDGLKVGSATLGKAALQDIPVDQIERIEIVRGPYSSLYGSEAIGGVIQIFTRRPQGAFSPNFSFAVGSHETARTAVGVGGRGDKGWYSVNAAHERTQGIDSCRGAGFPVFAGCFTVEPDKDAYRNTSLSTQGGYTFNEQWDAEARIMRAEGRNEYDGDFQNRSSVVEQMANAKVRYRPTQSLTLTLNAGESADLSDNYKDATAAGYFDTHRRQGSLQADIAAGGGGLFTVGFDWIRDRIDSDAGYPVTQRINHAVFGQWQQSFGAHSLQLSLRRDEDDQFGGETTGAALWGWDMTDALRFTASYGTAYKAPTFNELYFPFFGDPTLKPETSRSVELGLRGNHGWGGWSINAFETRAEDLIAYDPTPRAGLPFGGANNIDGARIRGVEADRRNDAGGLEPAWQRDLAGPARRRRRGPRQPVAAPCAQLGEHRCRPPLRRFQPRRQRVGGELSLRRSGQHAPHGRLRHHRPAHRLRTDAGMDSAAQCRQRVRQAVRNRGLLQPAGSYLSAERALPPG